MRPTQRIILNIVATYGRSIYAMAIGIFTSRWILLSLGEVNYGLLGLVGGLIGFISFFNLFLSGAIGRFYAFAVGRSMISGYEGEGLEECRKWFSLAVMVHAIIPVLLFIIGYPIGEWTVCTFLSIPPDRVEDCVLVFRFACVGCFISMVTVPFSAMYTAKQEIAELTIYGFIQSTALFMFTVWMVHHPGSWLVRYALFSCLVANIPQLIIMVRAYFCYQECRFRPRYCRDYKSIVKLISFAGWQAISTFGNMICSQGVTIVVNKYFGPAINASMAIASTVRTHANSLSGALVQAFMPAVTNECGKGDMDRMRSFSFQTCKYGLLLVLIFAIPLIIEIENIIKLWLKNPPSYVSFFCVCALIDMIADKSVCGHHTAIMAVGKISSYQICCGIILGLMFPMAWLSSAIGLGAVGVGASCVIVSCAYSFSRLYFANKYAGMQIGCWVRSVIVPITFTTLTASLIALVPRIMLTESFLRVSLTSIAYVLCYLLIAYYFVLDNNERIFVSKVVSTRVVFTRKIHA